MPDPVIKNEEGESKLPEMVKALLDPSTPVTQEKFRELALALRAAKMGEKAAVESDLLGGEEGKASLKARPERVIPRPGQSPLVSRRPKIELLEMGGGFGTKVEAQPVVVITEPKPAQAELAVEAQQTVESPEAMIKEDGPQNEVEVNLQTGPYEMASFDELGNPVEGSLKPFKGDISKFGRAFTFYLERVARHDARAEDAQRVASVAQAGGDPLWDPEKSGQIARVMDTHKKLEKDLGEKKINITPGDGKMVIGNLDTGVEEDAGPALDESVVDADREESKDDGVAEEEKTQPSAQVMGSLASDKPYAPNEEPVEEGRPQLQIDRVEHDAENPAHPDYVISDGTQEDPLAGSSAELQARLQQIQTSEGAAQTVESVQAGQSDRAETSVNISQSDSEAPVQGAGMVSPAIASQGEIDNDPSAFWQSTERDSNSNIFVPDDQAAQGVEANPEGVMSRQGELTIDETETAQRREGAEEAADADESANAVAPEAVTAPAGAEAAANTEAANVQNAEVPDANVVNMVNGDAAAFQGDGALVQETITPASASGADEAGKITQGGWLGRVRRMLAGNSKEAKMRSLSRGGEVTTDQFSKVHDEEPETVEKKAANF